MPKITFYRQNRIDGGFRTGIDIDEYRALESFIEGPPELSDESWGSTLRWFLDLIVEGDSLPSDPEECRAWLLDHEKQCVEGLRRAADLFRAGVDDRLVPLRWSEFEQLPEGVNATLLISAMRRVDAQELSVALLDFADHWVELLQTLEPFSLAQ